MWPLWWLLVQAPDPYPALQQKQYEEAIARFEKAIEAAPGRAGLRKDLAYTYLKIGETEAARDQFAEAMRLDPSDHHAALEYAFLCHETQRQAQARRVFDRIRRSGDPQSRATAEQAFQNIDRPLAEGVARWSKVVESDAGNLAAHLELAQLAERRDELGLAARHYRAAWRIAPSKRGLLVDLGRVLLGAGKSDEAQAALLAASRGPETPASEAARELLPERYPWVSEFRRAMELDPGNIPLRRDLAFLLLQMERQPEAEREFRALLELEPGDPLSSAQLGFLYLAREDRARAMPLLERVMRGPDAALAARVRGYLQIPAPKPDGPPAVSGDPKVMAERSLQLGYLQDALRFLHNAYEADRTDPWVQLKLGWTYNLLHDDRAALTWFDQARRSADARIAGEAGRAWRNLRPSLARFRTTGWLFPVYSSRWRDVFSYGQIKTELNTGAFPLRPYLSTRLLGDLRRSTGGALPQYLSENAVILAAGLTTRSWRGWTGWGEAGWAFSYLRHRVLPDYRGGLAYGKGFGPGAGPEAAGPFFETNADALFASRFENDFLLYSQNRWGYAPSPRTQLYWSGNFTADARRLEWANFAETGPGIRFRFPSASRSLVISLDALRGAYTVNQRQLRPAAFFDFRAGFWYAATH
ncbi:MAG: tetratricopeptide repeat protein [Candidatus Solibacter usitatus]|nr:tetratricopeptide repeat protein [Candidatus Solibacter usitatus]